MSAISDSARDGGMVELLVDVADDAGLAAVIFTEFAVRKSREAPWLCGGSRATRQRGAGARMGAGAFRGGGLVGGYGGRFVFSESGFVSDFDEAIIISGDQLNLIHGDGGFPGVGEFLDIK